MSLTDEQSRETGDAPPPSAAQQVKIFINYRRDDAQLEAFSLYRDLAERYGAENVFFDRANIKGGMDFLDEIVAHAGDCGVFLALIGPRWSSIIMERED